MSDMLERYKKMHEKLGKELKKSSVLRPKNGESKWRILPPLNDTDDFYLEVKKHFIGNQPVMCEKTFGPEKDCIICAIVEKLRDIGEKKAAYELDARSCYLLWVIDRDNEAEGPQIAEVKKQVIHAILGYVCDPEYGAVFDIKEGWDIKITREGQGRNNTSYSVRTSARPSPLAESAKLMQDWIEAMKPLKDTIRPTEDERIMNLLNEQNLTSYIPGNTKREKETSNPEVPKQENISASSIMDKINQMKTQG